MTRTLTLIPLFILIGACSGGSEKDGTGTDTNVDTPPGDDDDDDAPGYDDDDDDDDDDGCDNDVEQFHPMDGETEAFYRTDIAVNLDDPEPSATITVDGVSGSTEVEGVTVAFTPDAPLTPGSTYNAELSYSCGTEAWSFSVSGDGNPVTTSPNGKVYSIDLESGTFIVPGADTGDLVGELITGVEVLLSPTAEPTTEIPMIGAVGDGNGNQDICYETLAFPVTPAFEDPYFALESETLTITIAGVTATIDDLELSGAFTEDASAIVGGTLKGSIDTRSLKEALDLPTTAPDDAVCGVVSAVGVDCVECADGTGPYCLDLWVADLTAADVGGSIVEISAAQAEKNCP